MRSTFIFFAVILLGGIAVNAATGETIDLSAQDTAVLTVVLSHFSTSLEPAQFNPQGYIGIAPSTKALVAAISDKSYVEHQPILSPSAPESAVVNWVIRNRRAFQVGDFSRLGDALLINRAGWDVGFLPPNKNGMMRTYAYLRVPGYSPDGHWAYVCFEYLRSIHAAFATYLLKRVGGDWVVMAAKFD